MKTILKSIIYTTAFVGMFAVTVSSDTIYFKNGTRLDIEKLWEEDGKIKCIMYGNEYEYEKDEIEKIEKNRSVQKIKNPTTPNNEKIKQHISSTEITQPKKDSGLAFHLEALSFAKREKWVKAIEKEKQAFLLSPNEKVIQEALSYYHTMYAKRLHQRGQHQEALEQLNNALVYSPDYLPAKKGISSIYVMYAQNSYDQRDFDGAEIHLEKASRYYTGNAKYYVLSGKIAYDKDKYSEAKQEWQEALDIDPTLDEVKVLLKKNSQEHRVEKSFSSKKSGRFSVKFKGAEKSGKAEEAIKILNEAYLEVGSKLGEYPQRGISVIIYPKRDTKQLDSYPDFAAGLYDGKIRFSEDLFSNSSYLKAVLYHEYTHVIVHIIAGRNVPIWLNEGLAEYMARQFKPESHIASRERNLKVVVKNNSTIPFNRLSTSSLAGLKQLPYPLIALLYAQSDSFVTYFIERFTIYKVRSILEYLGNGDSIQNAIIDTTNYSLEDLESKWKNSLLEE